jgi:hypothetical protein
MEMGFSAPFQTLLLFGTLAHIDVTYGWAILLSVQEFRGKKAILHDALLVRY